MHAVSTGALSSSEVGGKETMDRRPLVCTHCGNRCRVPASPGRQYACPRCGHSLVLLRGDAGGGGAGPWGSRLQAAGRALLVPALFLTAAVLAVCLGRLSYRANAARLAGTPAHPVLVRLTPAEQRCYAYRLSQLEQDLARDDRDFEVLERLGHLHLQLAECQVAGRETHLRRARHYLLHASLYGMFRPDAFRIRALLEAANSPNPGYLLANLPGNGVGPPHDDEAWVRMRIGFLEEQAEYFPRSSRVLRLLGENYTALYSVMERQEGGSLAHGQESSAVSERGEAQRLAEWYFRGALDCARTREARCRALHGLAALYRAANQPSRSAVLLARLLSIQPNNWLAALEAASLCRQLGQVAKAERFQRQAARWRTPDWI